MDTRWSFNLRLKDDLELYGCLWDAAYKMASAESRFKPNREPVAYAQAQGIKKERVYTQ